MNWRVGRRLLPVAPAAATLAGFKGLAYCLEREVSFSKDEFRKFPVLEVSEGGPGTNIIKCGLPSPNHIMGMTVSAYVLVGGERGGEDGSGAYTPISTDEQPGYFELLVKGYPNGVVSKYLCSLKPGDSVEVKGPFTKLPYLVNMKSKIGMIAGGSGITPMLQVIREVLKTPEDKTQLTLIFGNQTPADIL